MKQFFGAFFGSIVGMIVATLLAVLIIVVIVKTSLNSALNNDETEQVVKANTVLKFEIDGAIIEREKENPFEGLDALSSLGDEGGMGLNTLVKKINAAKSDSNIKGIYIHIKNLDAGFATTQELRNTLADFKSGGKFIYSYGENFNQQEYYLVSVSDKIFLNPQGGMDWKGLNTSLMFFKGAFEKLDIEMQVFRHGKFKSAVEPFLADKMSASNRHQIEGFLSGIWNSMLKDISKDRNLSVNELNAMANDLRIQFPSDAVGNLIDVAAYEDEVMTQLKNKTKIDEKDKIKFVDLDKYKVKSKSDSKLNSTKIAVIYANGSISSGEGDDEEIGSDRIAKAIKDARLDDKIKAIVLRVNSPGGSALASDVIWREMVLAKKTKPVVVSMGNLAASGGYYISCGADRIFAQPNTITGSIGVFGLIPNVQKMLEKKLGLTIDTASTNKYSDFGTILRPVSEIERERIQASVEKVYDTFTSRVAEGRNMKQAMVDSIGQGRVWCGSDALKINLVDELGGLNEALAYAAKKAKLKEYKLVELPKQKNPFDDILGKKEAELESRIIKKNIGPAYIYFKQLQTLLSLQGIQTRLPFEMVIN